MRHGVRFVIVNQCDQPYPRLIAEHVDGQGYFYMMRSIEPTLKRYDGMTPSSPTSLEAFGFDIEVGLDKAVFSRVRPSEAKYSDGKTRYWQGLPDMGDSVTLPLVKLSRKRSE